MNIGSTVSNSYLKSYAKKACYTKQSHNNCTEIECFLPPPFAKIQPKEKREKKKQKTNIKQQSRDTHSHRPRKMYNRSVTSQVEQTPCQRLSVNCKTSRAFARLSRPWLVISIFWFWLGGRGGGIKGGET